MFGFGRAFHRRYKKEWRELKENWDAEFARAEVSVAVEVEIKEVLLATRRVSVPKK
ncbi:MAG: Ger(x)C family spore germination C-terminal domain-containing protein [Desulfotomaculales bacterium]